MLYENSKECKKMNVFIILKRLHCNKEQTRLHIIKNQI